MKLFRCVVEDNKDPEHLARVRLRIQGIHDPKLENVKTEELPWTECLNPLDAGNTLGSSTNVLVGTWGYCMSLNYSFTEFLFIGTVKGIFTGAPVETNAEGNDIGFRSQDTDYKFPTKFNEPDNRLTYGKLQEPDITQDRVQVAEFKEQSDTATDAVYPNNKVYEDHNGNIIEIDGTKNNSRIRIQHSTGARVEISTDGDITIQASKTGNIWQETPGLFAIGADGNMIIDCDVKITGSLEAMGEVSDLEGNLSSLRTAYDAHNHITTATIGASATLGILSIPVSPDPRIKFIWVGTPK